MKPIPRSCVSSPPSYSINAFSTSGSWQRIRSCEWGKKGKSILSLNSYLHWIFYPFQKDRTHFVVVHWHWQNDFYGIVTQIRRQPFRVHSCTFGRTIQSNANSNSELYRLCMFWKIHRHSTQHSDSWIFKEWSCEKKQTSEINWLDNQEGWTTVRIRRLEQKRQKIEIKLIKHYLLHFPESFISFSSFW